MGSSMTCKQQYCCGNMRDCTGPEDPYPRSEQPLTMSMFATKADLDKAKAEQASIEGWRQREASKAFAKWLEEGPRLAKAVGCYVAITVTDGAGK